MGSSRLVVQPTEDLTVRCRNCSRPMYRLVAETFCRTTETQGANRGGPGFPRLGSPLVTTKAQARRPLAGSDHLREDNIRRARVTSSRFLSSMRPYDRKMTLLESTSQMPESPT